MENRTATRSHSWRNLLIGNRSIPRRSRARARGRSMGKVRPQKRTKELPSISSRSSSSTTLTYDSPQRVTTLYAIALGWPSDGKMVIKSLAENSANYPRQIRKVELLGAKSELKWTRTAQGLEIQCPMSRHVSMHFRSESFRADLISRRKRQIHIFTKRT